MYGWRKSSAGVSFVQVDKNRQNFRRNQNKNNMSYVNIKKYREAIFSLAFRKWSLIPCAILVIKAGMQKLWLSKQECKSFGIVDATEKKFNWH